MRPRRLTVSSSNSPLVYPVDNLSGEAGVVTARPDGVSDYSIEWTADDINDPDIVPIYIPVINLFETALTDGSAFSTGITALRITLNSGTFVDVTVSQP